MTINCNGTLIDLSTPKVMGILNITPDSFFDGGRYENEKDMLNRAEKILAEGAAFIDLGAYSSRPGAEHVSEEEEIRRSVPAIELILKHFPEALISIDTFRSKVAAKCIEAGACMINDISAGNLDELMFETAARHRVPYIMMHMKGTPQNMQKNIHYDDLLKEMLFYFSEKVNIAHSKGINDIIIDPGFGFAKSLGNNYEILSKLELFKILELPLLVGVSRKSMIHRLLDIAPDDALNGTTVVNTISLMKGASVLRVHDVKEAVECVKIYEQLDQT